MKTEETVSARKRNAPAAGKKRADDRPRWNNLVKSPDEQYLLKRQAVIAEAVRAFGRNGYQNTSLDDIAGKLNVTKPALYYYFKSKEELLAVLFEETRDAVFALFDAGVIRKMDFGTGDDARRMLTTFLEVLEERQDVIRVVLMECAKRTPINDMIFSMIGEILDRMMALAADTGYLIEKDREKAKVTEFFTGMMPILNYVAYHEIWMERFGMEEPALRAQFIDAFLGTHMEYTVRKTGR